MSKNNKKKKHSKKEEGQGKKVVNYVFAALIILGLLLMIGFSFLA